MHEALADRDLRKVADVIDVLTEPAAVPGGVPLAVLVALSRLVPADAVTFFDIDPATRTMHFLQDWWSGEHVIEAEPITDPDAAFWRHYGQAVCAYPTRTGDDRTVLLRTDIQSDLERRRTGIYVDLMHEFPLYQMYCWMPLAGLRTPRFIFWRDGRDFTERERLLVSLLRPHLAEMRASQLRAASSALTERQSELMRLVAAGLTNPQIASALHLSPHTVRTHLEHIFDRLRVTTRTGAVKRFLELAGEPPQTGSA